MRLLPNILIGKRRKIGWLQESQRYTAPTCLGRWLTSSSKEGTAIGVTCETTSQCGQVRARFASWSWCSRPAASMWLDIGAFGGARWESPGPRLSPESSLADGGSTATAGFSFY